MTNAAQFPGPALWQGLMLCLFPLVVFSMLYRDGGYMRCGFVAYVVVGVVLFAVIAGAR